MKHYRDVFSEAGIKVFELSNREAAQRLQATGISESLIAGLDHWNSLLPEPSHEALIDAAKATGDWEAGIATARLSCASRDSPNALTYLDWAVMALMAGDTESYRQACEASRKANPLPDRREDAIHIARTCLLAPTNLLGVPIDQLPVSFWTPAIRSRVSRTGPCIPPSELFSHTARASGRSVWITWTSILLEHEVGKWTRSCWRCSRCARSNWVTTH